MKLLKISAELEFQGCEDDPVAPESVGIDLLTCVFTYQYHFGQSQCCGHRYRSYDL